MDDRQDRSELFGLKEGGIGMRVDPSDRNVVQHERLFEDTVVAMKEHPMFLGAPLPRVRFIFVLVIILACVTALLGRAFWMQIVNGRSYVVRADQNRLRHEVVAAKRGVIRDRNGTILAENIPSFDLQVTPRLLPQSEEDQDVLLARIGRETGIGLEAIKAAVASSTDPDERMTLVRDLSYERAISISILVGDDPAFEVASGSKRRYPLSSTVPSLSHVLGYIGPITREDLERQDPTYRQTDVIGKTGVEDTYETILRGSPGEKVYEVDAKNRITSLLSERDAEDGVDVRLNIDAKLQQAAQTALQRQMAAAHLSRGAAIAMDPRDGSVLALVSLPAYDDNFFSGVVSSTYYLSLLKNEDRPLLPRAISGVYPSGSTIKPAIAAAALAEGVITPNTTVNSVGGIHVGASFFPDWKAGGHGLTNVRKAIAWSVNTFFYTVGGGFESFIGLGVDRLSSWFKRFGLSQKTGIDLTGESSGFVPTKEWKENVKKEHWYIGDTYNLSIGQGDLLVTPLQIATVTAEIANGGKKIVPRVAVVESHVESLKSKIDQTPIVDASFLKTVQLGMRDTVVYGSGRALSSFPVAVAGKTGTAQWRNDRPNHAWFTCYAPFEDPQIVVTVLLEEGVEGSVVSVPVTKDILTAWMQMKKG